MSAFMTKLEQFFRANYIKTAAVVMLLTLVTVAGVWLMVDAFNHQTSTPTGKNGTNTVVTTNHSYFTSLSLTSNLVTALLTTSVPGSSGASVRQRGHRDTGDGDMNSGHFGAVGHSSNWVASTSITPIDATEAAILFSSTGSTMHTTFENIFTDPFSTPMGFFAATPFVIPAARSRIEADDQTMSPPRFTRPPTGTRYAYIASQMQSEAGVHSTAISDSRSITNLALSQIGVAASTSSPPSQEPDSAATTEGAAASMSLVTAASLFPSPTSPNPSVADADSSSAPVTLYALNSIENIPSSTASTEENEITSTLQNPAAASGESYIPDEEGHTLPQNYYPFATTASVPSGSLTYLESGLSAIPTQGVPSTPLAGVAASISSIVAASLATVINATVSPTVSTFAVPPTQLQSVPPTSVLTSTSTVASSSDDYKQPLSIGLGICLPILALVAAFIIFWLWTRRVERKKKDDLEKEIIWETPPPSTPNASGTLRNMTKMDHAGGNKIEGKRATTPMKINPLAMHPLNEEELAIAQQYGLAVDTAKAQQAAGTMTSARSPVKSVQRRSGGTNLSRQWVDGANDTPLCPSQTFTRNQGDLLDPFGDANAIGLAVSTDDHYRSNRNDLFHFQPTRLSTITDKSGEIEMPEIPAPFRAAGSGLITPEGNAKGRFFERFMMKRKGMMPLDG